MKKNIVTNCGSLLPSSPSRYQGNHHHQVVKEGQRDMGKATVKY